MATYKVIETRHLYGPRQPKTIACDQYGETLEGLTHAEAIKAIERLDEAQVAQYGCPELAHNEYAPPTYTIVAEQ